MLKTQNPKNQKPLMLRRARVPGPQRGQAAAQGVTAIEYQVQQQRLQIPCAQLALGVDGLEYYNPIP